MSAKLRKHWWACGSAWPRAVGSVQAVAGGLGGVGRARAPSLVQQQHVQQHVEQNPLMGFCRIMSCVWLGAGHVAVRALARSRSGLRGRAVRSARLGVRQRGSSGGVEARWAGRSTHHALTCREFFFTLHTK